MLCTGFRLQSRKITNDGGVLEYGGAAVGAFGQVGHVGLGRRGRLLVNVRWGGGGNRGYLKLFLCNYVFIGHLGSETTKQ